MLQDFSEQYALIWEKSSVEVPDFPKTYTSFDKREREQSLDQFIKSIKSFRKQYIRNKTSTKEDERLFFDGTRTFLRLGLDFDEDQLEMMFSDELIEATQSFVRKARIFDPELKFADIFQACRNAWIMHGLQLIMGYKIQLTSSILAYSLLYPYTDNMLDDPSISGYEKMIFSERFRERLSGIIINPENRTENAVFQLVEMIEEQYSRQEFPDVYDSLLEIHRAQTNSLKLIYQGDLITEKETLKICIAKGGASVLADGFLVAGKLTPEQQFFLTGYGSYLQLLDDIQDVDEDRKAGLMTVFSKDAFRLPLDQKLNKTYWFGKEVMKSLDFFDGKHIDLFKSLMRKSMDLFIIEAIAQNPDLYSPAYIVKFEQYSPFHFDYIRKEKERFGTYKGFLLTTIEQIVYSESYKTIRRSKLSME